MGADVDVNLSVLNSYAGGLIGVIYTNGRGSVAVSNSYALGNINAGLYGGGLVGSLHYFTSISNSFAAGNVMTLNGTGAYAGGLTGAASYETAIINSFSIGESFFAPNSSNSYYASYAGAITGFNVEGGYKDGTDLLGTLVYRSYCLDTANAVGDRTNNLKTPVTRNELLSLSWQQENLGWDENVWTLENNKLPTLKEYSQIVNKENVQVTLHANYSEGTDREVTLSRFEYNPLKQQSFTNPNFNFYEWTYDAEGLFAYRPYVPLIEGINYYARYVDYNVVAGKYYGESDQNGYFDVKNDGTLVWVKYDGEIDEGTYRFDGEYFVFTTNYYDTTICSYDLTNNTFTFEDANADYYTYLFTKANALLGTWLDTNGNIFKFDGNETATYNNGVETKFTYSISGTSVSFVAKGSFEYTLSGTLNSDGTQLTVVFTDDYDDSFPLVFNLQPTIPDYSSASFLGKYYGPNGLEVTLEENGNASACVNGGTSYAGGYRVYGNRLEINVFGKIKATMTYNAAKDAFFASEGSVKLLTRNPQKATYSSTKDNLSIYVCDDGSYYVIRSNQLVNATITGTLKEGENIVVTISSTEYKYTISNGALIDTPIYVIPQEMIGEWTVTFTASSSDLIISESEIVYNEFTCTIVSASDNELVVKSGYYFTLTITIGEEGTLNVVYDDGEYPLNGVASKKVSAEPTLVGTWTGKIGPNNQTIVIDSDYNVSLNGENPVAGNYNSNTKTLTWSSNGWNYSITLNSDGTTASASMVDDYDEYSFDGKLTKVA